MRRLLYPVALTCMVVGLLVLTSSGHAQQLQPRLLRSFNISSIFDGSAQGCGEAAIDVAFDGTNAYVAGFRGTSGVGPVGIVRIDNVLTLPSGSLSYGPGVTKILGWNAAGGSRDTRLVYHNGYLYVGFGLGHSANPDTAIVRLNTFGVIDELWSGDGLLSLADIGATRYDTLAIDPGYLGSGQSLAVGVLNTANPQAIRRVSLASGAPLGTSNTFTPTFLRDIAFAPNGDVYMHRASTDANDGIFKAVRLGADLFGAATRIIPFDAGNLQQGTVNYVPASQVLPVIPDLLVYNLRTQTLDPTTHKVYVTDPNGNPLGEWDGSGVTVDGVRVGAFGYNLINVASYLLPGRVLLFVVSGQTPAAPQGTIDRLDVLEIALTTRISGTVTLEDFGGNVSTVPVVFEIRSPGGTTPLETYVVYPSSTGAYEFATSLRGTYDIAAKASHWLRQAIRNVNLTGSPRVLNFNLVNGDIDGDNEVSLFDFGNLVAAFGSVPGDSNWNPNADLDGDNDVSLFDFGVLVRNFGLVGDD